MVERSRLDRSEPNCSFRETPCNAKDRIDELGIVGAGGGGFPASVKFDNSAPLLVINGAECEPLLHKDKELLTHHLANLFSGMSAAMERICASGAVIGIKEKYPDLIRAIANQAPAAVRVVPLMDTYPAGDEFILVHDITGKIIPPGGLPKDVGVIVSNVETLVNVGIDRPVTHKFLTVAGAVKSPATFRVPIGIAISELIAAAGGATVPDYGVLLGGVMMGRLARTWDEPVIKTTGGIVVLPSAHPLITRQSQEWSRVRRIGKSACDQCRFCTELCPRYLLGHPIQPHRAMQALGFSAPDHELVAGTLYCCECNLCSLYSCPDHLDPRMVCVQAKPAARKNGLVFTGQPRSVRSHPLASSRRVPTRRLMERLGLVDYTNSAPLTDWEFSPKKVRLPLRQHAGTAAIPVVRAGERVRVGDVVAIPQIGALGARIHASINGRIADVTDAVVIEA